MTTGTDAAPAQTTTEAGAASEASSTPAEGSTLLTAPGAPAADAGTTATTDSPEGQGAGEGQEGDAGDGKPADDKPAGAPEKYELALPEGFTLDDAALGKFEPVLRDLNLSNEQASKLAGVYADMMAAQAESHLQLVQEWGAQAQKDPVIGGEKFAENVEVARKALAYVGDPELTALMDQWGLGNNPAVLRAFHKLGQLIPGGDPGVSGDRTGGTSERSLAERLYGKTTP